MSEASPVRVSKAIPVKVLIELSYELPEDEDMCMAGWGVSDIMECVQVDWNSDPVAMFCDYESRLVSVNGVAVEDPQ